MAASLSRATAEWLAGTETCPAQRIQAAAQLKQSQKAQGGARVCVGGGGGLGASETTNKGRGKRKAGGGWRCAAKVQRRSARRHLGEDRGDDGGLLEGALPRAEGQEDALVEGPGLVDRLAE